MWRTYQEMSDWYVHYQRCVVCMNEHPKLSHTTRLICDPCWEKWDQERPAWMLKSNGDGIVHYANSHHGRNVILRWLP